MILETFEGYAKANDSWLQARNDANSASIASVRITFGQSRELRRVYFAWLDLLRRDRALRPALTPAS